MADVGLGLVGLGGVGAVHFECLSQGDVKDCRLVAVCELKRALADEKARAAGAKAFYDYRELLDSGECDAVLVATPHPLHPRMCIDAMEAGLHVLCEKPMAVRPSAADAMVETARRTGKLLGVMFQMRTEPVQARLRELANSGELGERIRINMFVPWYRTQAYYDSDPWRGTWKGEGGGVLANQSPHNLDELLGLWGMPRRVFALTATRGHDIEAEDDCTAFLEYEDGATAIFQTSTIDPFGGWRTEVVGTKAKLVVDDDGLRIGRVVETGAGGRAEMWATREVAWQQVEVQQAPAGQAVLVQNFVNAVLRGEGLIAPAEDAAGEVELASAMILSGRKKQPVELPVDREEYDRLLDGLIEKGIG